MTSPIEMQQVTVEEEFKKNPDLKTSDLDQLRGWLETQPHLPEISDRMLILIHHSCYFDMTLTKETIETHYTMRTNTPEFFTNRDVTSPELAKAMQVINISPLPIPDPNGNRIIYLGLNDFDPSNYVPQDAAKLLFMTTDVSGIQHGTVSGYHSIFDLKGAKLMHLAQLSLYVLKKFVLYSEKALPLRRKEIHLVNVVPWIDKFFALAKPWISKHTMDNIYFHGDGFESLHKHIPIECLPKELGGVLESLDVYYAANRRLLKDMCEYFTEDEKIRVDESKRINQTGREDDMGVQGTFRKLELD